MAEYIEREAAIRVVNGQSSLTMTRSSLIDSISKLPDADVAPVVHVQWKCRGDCGVTECPACGWSIEEYVGDYDYCPKCGAKMDGGADG